MSRSNRRLRKSISRRRANSIVRLISNIKAIPGVAPATQSFVPQHDNGIEAHGPARGDVARRQGNDDEQHCYSAEGGGIGGADAEELLREETREGEGRREADTHARCREFQTVAHNHPKNVALPGAES